MNTRSGVSTLILADLYRLPKKPWSFVRLGLNLVKSMMGDLWHPVLWICAIRSTFAYSFDIESMYKTSVGLYLECRKVQKWIATLLSLLVPGLLTSAPNCTHPRCTNTSLTASTRPPYLCTQLYPTRCTKTSLTASTRPPYLCTQLYPPKMH